MAKIETYTVADSPISGSDKLIGTDSAHDNATKNFTIAEIADYISSGTGYVPYTGATDDVDLGSYNLMASQVVSSAVQTQDITITGVVSFDGSQGTAGQVLISQGIGNTPIWGAFSLQNATNFGNVTTNSIYSQASMSSIGVKSTDGNTRAYLSHFSNSGNLSLVTASGDEGVIKVNNLTTGHDYQLPDAGGILAVSTTVGYNGSKTIGGEVYTWENGILISVV